MRFVMLLAVMVSSASALAQTFEIIDGSANIYGDPATSKEEARANWSRACEDWKRETREFNKSDQIMMLSCEQPTCVYSSDTGKSTCTSTAAFKVKTQGTRAYPPVAQYPQPQQQEQQEETIDFVEKPSSTIIVREAPPRVVYERTPSPRLGFLWIAGFWNWSLHNHRYVWVPGRWERHRPGYHYRHPRWSHRHGRGWEHNHGGWERDRNSRYGRRG